MSVKETIHQWIERLPENAPGLLDLYEQARLDQAIREAKEDVREGRMLTYEQLMEQYEERCRQRRSS